LLAALRGEGPYWILALSGEQGSAKTTLSRMIGALVDPQRAPLRTLPGDTHDLYIAAKNGHILAFDNVSDLKPWLSDAFCRLATGGSFATRKKYSDDREIQISAKLPLILNGIEQFIVRQDLADRTISITLDSILEDQRSPEDELWASFNELAPLILGALLDAVVQGLNNYCNIVPKWLPRMADCAKFVLACEPALWPAGTFQHALRKNHDEAVQIGIEDDPVASALVAMAMQTMQTMHRRPDLADQITVFEGTATELLKELRSHCDEFLRRSSTHFPLTPQALSGRLKRVTPALRERGVTIGNSRMGRKSIRMMNVSVVTERFNYWCSVEGELYLEGKAEICDDAENANSSAHQASPQTSSASSAEMPPKSPEPAKKKIIIAKRKTVSKDQLQTPVNGPSAK
jgi:hypothetical protein